MTPASCSIVLLSGSVHRRIFASLSLSLSSSSTYLPTLLEAPLSTPSRSIRANSVSHSTLRQLERFAIFLQLCYLLSIYAPTQRCIYILTRTFCNFLWSGPPVGHGSPDPKTERSRLTVTLAVISSHLKHFPCTGPDFLTIFSPFRLVNSTPRLLLPALDRTVNR